MQIKRTWLVASATLAVAGFAGAGIALAADDVPVNDQRQVSPVHLNADEVANTSGGVDNSPESADSPDDPGQVAPAQPAPAPAPDVDSGDTANTANTADSASGDSAD